MILLDTAVFLDLVQDGPRMGPERLLILRNESSFALCDLSLHELASWLEEGRIEIAMPWRTWLESSFHHLRILPVGLTPAIAVRASRLAAPGLDRIDRTLAATSLELGMELATLNPGFRAVSGLRLVF
jgi:PIN domain nuclease of toxin-antitoxin system